MIVAGQNTPREDWNERLTRIEAGRTITQGREAQGTVPMRGYKRQRGRGKRGFLRSAVAMILCPALGVTVGMVALSVSPADRIVEIYELNAAGPVIQEYANPVIALAAYFIVVALLGMRSAFSILLGCCALAYILAPTYGVVVPDLAMAATQGATWIDAQLGLDPGLMDRVTAAKDRAWSFLATDG